MSQPRVTVTMSTWNRGAHVLPSVKSVLAQTMRDFELLVIGDAATDDTGAQVLGLGDPRVRWLNLETRWGTQSGPNNRGIEEARGEILCNIGHDDVWAPDHLESILSVYRDRPDVGSVASGVLLHRDDQAKPHRVWGVFDETVSDYETLYFTPPSGYSVRRTDDLPKWLSRKEAERPIDVMFQKHCLDRGLPLVSTGRITVHKWAAVAQYLSYLLPESSLQEDMIRRLGDPDYEHWLAERAQIARDTDMFMIVRNAKRSAASTTSAADKARGIDLAPLRALGEEQKIPMDDSPRALDWRPVDGAAPGLMRWCGPNTQPRLLVPVTGCEAGLVLMVQFLAGKGWPVERVLFNGQVVEGALRGENTDNGMTTARLRLNVELLPDRPSVLSFELPTKTFAEPRSARNGFAAGTMRLFPLPAKTAR